MKKHVLILGLLVSVSLLLSACGKKNTEAAEYTPSESIEDLSDAEPETDGLAVVEETSSAAETEAEIQPGESEFTLYEDETYTIILYTAKAFSTGENGLYLYTENRGKSEPFLELENLTLNDSVFADGTTCLLSAGETECTRISSFSQAYEFLEENLRKITFELTIEDYDQAEPIITDSEISLEPENGFGFEMKALPFLSSFAEEQILADTDKVLIRASKVGNWLGGPYYSSCLGGYVTIENRCDYSIPVKVTGIVVNGMTFDGNCSGSSELLPGCSRVIWFYLRTDDLEEAGVELISDLSLLIVSSVEDNTAVYGIDGGTAYTVDLSMKGEEEEAVTPEGDPVFSEGGIAVYADGKDENSSGKYYRWYFAVVNDSDENIEIRLANTVESDGSTPANFIFCGDSDVAAHTTRRIYVCASVEEGAGQPVFTGQFMILTKGGAKMLFLQEEAYLFQ